MFWGYSFFHAKDRTWNSCIQPSKPLGRQSSELEPNYTFSRSSSNPNELGSTCGFRCNSLAVTNYLSPPFLLPGLNFQDSTFEHVINLLRQMTELTERDRQTSMAKGKGARRMKRAETPQTR